MKIISILLVGLIILLSGCQSAWQIKPKKLATGLVELKSLYENHKGVVVIFWQRACPCVKRYEARVKKLYDKYERQGLSFVYMSSNTNESLDQVQSAYAQRNMPLRLVRDEGGLIARKVKAKGTPAALLITPQGDVIYMGWIDNERREGESGRIAYLENAIEEFLGNQSVKIKTSPMFGCPIR